MLEFPRPRRRIPYDPDPELLRPSLPAPVIAPAPVVDVGPPPLTTDDRRGRPRIVPGVPAPERMSAEQELMDRLQSYEPQKRSRLRMIGLSALRGLAAGPGGALTGALWGTGAALLDPTMEDRAWRDRELMASQQRQGTLREDRRGELRDDLLNAQVEETRAQAEARRNPRPRLVEQVLPDGTQVLTPEAPGVVTGRVRPPTPRIAVDVPGVGPIEATPEAALGYYGQVGRRGEEQTKARLSLSEAEAAERENLQQRAAASQVLSNLREQRRLLRPKSYVDGKINDPDYWPQLDAIEAQIKDAETEVSRRQSLADEAAKEVRRLRGEVGPARTTAPPPPAGVSEASIRAEARRRGANEEEAVKRARDFGWIR